jgi:signal transduction histidine kinase
MTTSFLNFARPQPLQLEDVSLDDLIQECARDLHALFDEHRVKPVIEKLSSAPPQSFEIQADPRMLRQALLNLLRNAAEAIPNDNPVRQVTVHISFENQSGKQWAMVSIRDTGEGVAPADLQKIFIPFFTTKSGGHGIGLALAHRVITEHGGTLTAANAPAGGAIFTMRLPL